MTWMPSTNQLAQTSHFFIATTIVLAAHSFGFRPPWGLVWVFVWALPKEFIFDLLVEGDSLESSVEDFCWYGVGAAAGGLLGLFGG